MSTIIRIDSTTLDILKRLEEQTGNSKKKILRQALDKFQRDKMIDDLNTYYEALRADPEHWEEELVERVIWNRSSNDGLEDL